MQKIISLILILMFSATILSAQRTLNIGICKDANSAEFNEFSTQLKKEIQNLSGTKFNIKFTELNAGMDTVKSKENISALINNPQVDYVISLGYISSRQISQLKSYPKPVIAATILDGELQNLPLRKDKSTGINNFTYIESVIRLKQNLKDFSEIFKTKDIAVFIPEIFKDNFPHLDTYFNQNKAGYNISIIPVTDNAEKALSKVPENTEVAVVLPLIGFSQSEIQKLFAGLNTKHIPSLATAGIKYLDAGATVSMTPEYTFQQLARQIALRIMKINEGSNPSELSTDIDYKQVSIINMESIRLTNKFPDWNVMNESILINVTNFSNGTDINLRKAVADALENNLQLKMSAKDVEIADKEVRIAKANIYPQLSIGGTAVGLSDNIVEASMGQKGDFTITGSASLKQVIFSEAAFANIAINKLMAENKRIADNQAVLDMVLNTTSAYINLLFTKSNLLIQNENVNTTNKNLQTAKAKEEVGQTGLSDVNRWVSELNLNKMKFNDAYTAYRSTMYQINQITNSEINATVNLSDSNNVDESIFIQQDLLKTIFENPVLTERYAGFVLEEMRANSPELKQIEGMTEILEKKQKLYKHQNFMPELAAFANADQAFVRNGTIAPVGLPIPPPPDDVTYNFGLSLRIPIFQGGKASANAQKTRMELEKVNFQREELNKKLETAVRANVQKLRASYLELELSKNAAKAAAENYNIVRDAYFQGAVNLIQLIDAQNVTIKTKQMANVAYYQYILDYLTVERYQGKFTFLSSDEDKQDYINRLQNLIKE